MVKDNKIITEFSIYTLVDLKNFSDFLKTYYWQEQIFLLKGPLGIGKTQLVKYLLENLIEESVTSPTFNMVNTYNNKENPSISYWHFDLYNKNNISYEILEELGFSTIWENINNKCFMEWPEKLNFILKGTILEFISNGTYNIIKIICKKEN